MTGFAFFCLSSGLIWLLQVISCWKMFEKANRDGWLSLVPIYNVAVKCEIAGEDKMFFALLLGFIFSFSSLGLVYASFAQMSIVIAYCALGISLFALILMVIAQWKISCGLAKVFGQSKDFALGLFLVPDVFQIMLGFGDAKYILEEK